MDLKLDTTGDLAIENDSFVLVDGVDAIVQDLTIRFQFFQGEWFLDTRLGMPYYQKILGEKPRLNIMKNIFRKAILLTPGILSLTDLDIVYDGASRLLSVSFQGKSTEGEFSYDKEFIL